MEDSVRGLGVLCTVVLLCSTTACAGAAAAVVNRKAAVVHVASWIGSALGEQKLQLCLLHAATVQR
jgi:hypothetical protein